MAYFKFFLCHFQAELGTQPSTVCSVVPKYGSCNNGYKSRENQGTEIGQPRPLYIGGHSGHRTGGCKNVGSTCNCSYISELNVSISSA